MTAWFLLCSSLTAMIIRFLYEKIERWAGIILLGSSLFFLTGILLMVWKPATATFMLAGTALGIFSGAGMTKLHLTVIQAVTEEAYPRVNTLFYFAQDVSFVLCGIFWAFVNRIAGYEKSFIISGIIVFVTAIIISIQEIHNK